jgi:hypothetical protein
VSDEPTLAEQLRAAGYGYRPSKIVNKQEVFRMSDGDVMGQFSAFEAYHWLTRLAPADAAVTSVRQRIKTAIASLAG